MKQKIHSALLFSTIFLLFSCQSGTGQNMLSPQDFKAKLEQQPDAVALDVRSPDEYNSGHVPGAVNIDFDSREFDREIAKMDTSKTYLLYCSAGGRARGAAKKMEAAGFKNIFEIKGGYPDWEKAGYAVEK